MYACVFIYIYKCMYQNWIDVPSTYLDQGCGLFYLKIVQLDIPEYGAESHVTIQDMILPVLVKPVDFMIWHIVLSMLKDL